MTDQVKNHDLFNDLLTYFSDEQQTFYKNLGTGTKALNRADTFLFGLSYLDLNKEITDNILASWYALVPSFLLMDDVSDLEKDKDNKEENFILDIGGGSRGVNMAIDFLREKFNWLKGYNCKLGLYFERSLDRKLQTGYMQTLLNNDS